VDENVKPVEEVSLDKQEAEAKSQYDKAVQVRMEKCTEKINLVLKEFRAAILPVMRSEFQPVGNGRYQEFHIPDVKIVPISETLLNGKHLSNE
jgi:hypothetical protein